MTDFVPCSERRERVAAQAVPLEGQPSPTAK
jgi:hypothetical protein